MTLRFLNFLMCLMMISSLSACAGEETPEEFICEGACDSINDVVEEEPKTCETSFDCLPGHTCREGTCALLEYE